MSLDVFYNKTATIKILTYVGDVGTYGGTTTIKGYLRPLSETEATTNGFQFGQAFAFQVPITSTIKESDTIEIDGKEYKVQGVAKHLHDLPVDHHRILLTLSIDEK